MHTIRFISLFVLGFISANPAPIFVPVFFWFFLEVTYPHSAWNPGSTLEFEKCDIVRAWPVWGSREPHNDASDVCIVETFYCPEIYWLLSTSVIFCSLRGGKYFFPPCGSGTEFLENLPTPSVLFRQTLNMMILIIMRCVLVAFSNGGNC